ncbi:hypothetical protein GQR58_002663 [Nymphon striatum]|nr:hypothetical protein GQR58_002663 [Nymphon striatum]
MDPPSLPHRNRSAPKVTLIMMKLDKVRNSSAETNINHNLSFLDTEFIWFRTAASIYEMIFHGENQNSVRGKTKVDFLIQTLHPYTSSNFLCPTLKQLNVTGRITLQLGCLAFRAASGTAPDYTIEIDSQKYSCAIVCIIQSVDKKIYKCFRIEQDIGDIIWVQYELNHQHTTMCHNHGHQYNTHSMLYVGLTNCLSLRMCKITAFEMYMYRRILKIPWTDKMTNEQVLGVRELTETSEITIEKSEHRKIKGDAKNGRRDVQQNFYQPFT